MSRRMPPLNALRAFESAARHLSFRAAGAELCVTPGAISQHIKRLESELGVELFQRSARVLQLTQEGKDYLPIVSQAFDAIAEATNRVRSRTDTDRLTVSVLSGFAIRWLIPRLGRFRDLHPAIDVRIATSNHLVDFHKDDVDVGIRHGSGRYPGLRTWPLFTDDVVVVCNPTIIDGGLLNEPRDLQTYTLLHDDNHPERWHAWFQRVGMAAARPRRSLTFSDHALLLEAAIDGQGIALTQWTLVQEDITARRLVTLFDFSVPSEPSYYLVCPEVTSNIRKIAVFREWLLGEAKLWAGKIAARRKRASHPTLAPI